MYSKVKYRILNANGFKNLCETRYQTFENTTFRKFANNGYRGGSIRMCKFVHFFYGSEVTMMIPQQITKNRTNTNVNTLTTNRMAISWLFFMANTMAFPVSCVTIMTYLYRCECVSI